MKLENDEILKKLEEDLAQSILKKQDSMYWDCERIVAYYDGKIDYIKELINLIKRNSLDKNDNK